MLCLLFRVIDDDGDLDDGTRGLLPPTSCNVASYDDGGHRSCGGELSSIQPPAHIDIIVCPLCLDYSESRRVCVATQRTSGIGE